MTALPVRGELTAAGNAGGRLRLSGQRIQTPSSTARAANHFVEEYN
jgi:hypothetical protein